MALTIGDNFSYMGAKPLDGRLKYDTVASMKAMADSVLYDGCLAYCTATDKTYQWKSTNEVDATLGKWREFSSGAEIEVDDEIDSTSENPVQNKVIAEALDEKADLVSGKVPATQLPSYVDDVIEGYYNENDGKFYEESTYETEIVGEAGKIYLSLDTNFEYRWTGNAFARVNEGVVLGETSSTAYRGDRGKTAYEDSQTNKEHIGDLDDLLTSEKSNLVGAINEVSAGVSIQKSVMPTPASQYEDVIVEYVGETDANFTNGYFYKCKKDEEIVDRTYNIPEHPTTYTDWDMLPTITMDQTVTTNKSLKNGYYVLNGVSSGQISVDAPLSLAVQEGDELGFKLPFSGCIAYYKELVKTYYWEQWDVQPSTSYSAGDGIEIDDDEISVDAMPAEDMSEVATPLPSVMSRRFKYSTEEQVVGEWIDGKPLYQKTIDCGALPNNSSKFVEHHISNIDKVVSISAVGIKSSGTTPIPYINTDNLSYQIQFELVTSTDIKIYTKFDYSDTNAYVTLQYTKTTD